MVQHEQNQTYYTYDTAMGNITIAASNGSITAIHLENAKDWRGTNIATQLTDLAAAQLEEYFAGKRERFDLPLHPVGTAFQQAVWKELTNIPYGQTRSYRQVAQAVGNPNASRAVGLANSKNPIWVVIPCHRVVGANGSLVGYAGGLDMKRQLLELESGGAG